MTYTVDRLVQEYDAAPGHRGIRAACAISEGTLIGIYDGELVRLPVRDGRLLAEGTHRDLVQVREEPGWLYGLVSPAGVPASGIDFINHSCNATVVAQDRIVLIVARDVDAGEALTIDYRSWDLVAEGIACWCRGGSCRI